MLGLFCVGPIWDAFGSMWEPFAIHLGPSHVALDPFGMQFVNVGLICFFWGRGRGQDNEQEKIRDFWVTRPFVNKKAGITIEGELRFLKVITAVPLLDRVAPMLCDDMVAKFGADLDSLLSKPFARLNAHFADRLQNAPAAGHGVPIVNIVQEICDDMGARHSLREAIVLSAAQATNIFWGGWTTVPLHGACRLGDAYLPYGIDGYWVGPSRSSFVSLLTVSSSQLQGPSSRRPNVTFAPPSSMNL